MRAMAEPADLNLDELKRRGRRRLIGAIVLALVAAVVVPMLLESDPKPLGEDVSVRIPPVDEGKFVNRLGDVPGRKSLADAEKSVLTPGTRPSAPAETKAVPPAPAPAAAPPPAAAPVPAETKAAAPAAPPTPAKTAETKAAETKAAETKAAETKTAAPAPAKAADASAPPAATPKADAPKEGGYVVQLAAFSDDKGANALAGKLKRSGYPAYTETLTTTRGTLWRVRVGPFPSRDAAAQSRDRLKGEGHAGIVVPAK
jgi:DedD protein